MNSPKPESPQDGFKSPEKGNILPGPYPYPPRDVLHSPYDYPHPASVSTATSEGDKKDLAIDGLKRTSSGR
jgi:hypothetical protein